MLELCGFQAVKVVPKKFKEQSRKYKLLREYECFFPPQKLIADFFFLPVLMLDILHNFWGKVNQTKNQSWYWNFQIKECYVGHFCHSPQTYFIIESPFLYFWSQFFTWTYLLLLLVMSESFDWNSSGSFIGSSDQSIGAMSESDNQLLWLNPLYLS